VYTLPNIVIGEIAIRHHLTGENIFFIGKAFDAGLMVEYTEDLFASGACDSAINGWVNFDGNDFEAFIYLVESGKDSTKNANFVNRLYQENIWTPSSKN
jgi:hypothetical protein